MIPVIWAAMEAGKPVEMTVTGKSMMPLLLDRISSVRLTQPNDLKKGDIVLFRRSDDRYALHRIVGVCDGVYDIIGDNQRVPDRCVPKEDIIALVTAYSRDGKHWREKDGLYRVFLPVLKTARRYAYGVKRKLDSFIKRKKS